MENVGSGGHLTQCLKIWTVQMTSVSLQVLIRTCRQKLKRWQISHKWQASTSTFKRHENERQNQHTNQRQQHCPGSGGRVHFGSKVTKGGDSMSDVTTRLSKGNQAFAMLRPVSRAKVYQPTTQNQRSPIWVRMLENPSFY